jgi:hypothetical protein
MGSARSLQLARETAAQVERQSDLKRKQKELQRKQELYEAQLVALKGQYESERDAILRDLEEEEARQKVLAQQRMELARLRRADQTALKIDENGARKARKGALR